MKNDANLTSVSVDIVGAPVTKIDVAYEKKIFSLSLALKQSLNISVAAPDDMPGIYQHHHILIHTSRTGSMDKVVLEALASGRWVVTSSEAYVDLAKDGLVYAFPIGNYLELAKTIEKVCCSGILHFQFGQFSPNQKGIDYVYKNHNLDTLINKLIHFFSL